MTQRKKLKNIAHGLLGRFVSRNNDIDGYWGLGVLKSHAIRHGLPSLVIDLLGQSSTLEASSPVQIAEKTYQHWLFEACSKIGFNLKELEGGKIHLRFTTFEEFPNTIRDTRGQPYECNVILARSDGITYSASKIGVCATHDPKKDHRSNRVD